MSPQDNVLFLQVAVKKGYLNSQQAASIFSQSNNNDSLLSFLKSNKILSSQQIRDIETFLHHYHHDSTSRGITDNTSAPRSLQQKNIDRYQVLQELGRGGMGTVYKCWDPKLQRTIALKTLIHRGDTNSISRFLVEIRATIQLHHPNIIRIYEVGEENGIHFFTMDYLNGVSFHELIHEKKISLRKSIHMIIKIAKALDYAHNQGIIHRDLKPTNIMVDNNMEPFVVDFGLAKMVGQNNQITESGTVLGTPHYMAPEQAMGNIRNIDTRTDIYALGVILYEAITGKLPFYSNNRVELMVKIVEKTPLLPSRSNKRISKQLDAICLKAMAKKKEERYCSANDFAEDLESYTSGQPPQAFEESKQSKKKWPIILATVVVIVVSLFFYMPAQPVVQTETTSQTKTISNEKLDNLIQACFNNAELELDLDKQQINDEELTYILQKIPQLNSLNLSRVKTICGSSFEHLARFKDTLVRLDLKACSIENKYLVHLQKLHVLNRIDFEDTNFDQSGLFHLKDMKQLQSLDLSGSKIASLIYIQNLHQLQRLELAETNINDDDLRHIVHLHKLHILALESTNITNDALKYLIQLKSLETLSLKRTPIDNGAVVYFKQLPRLYELHLKGTKVTLDAMYKIQTFAPRCKIKYQSIQRYRFAKVFLSYSLLETVIPVYFFLGSGAARLGIKMTSLKIGVVGFSRPQFNHQQATEILKTAIAKFIEQFNADKVEIVSGLTNIGVPKLAYEVAVEQGFATVGISAKQALRVGCGIFAVDKQIIEGKKFGDESQVFIDYIDCLIRVGGGKQSHKEVEMFREKTQNNSQLLLEYEIEFLEQCSKSLCKDFEVYRQLTNHLTTQLFLSRCYILPRQS